MRAFFIDEPELEFGGEGRHIDVRHGIARFGPLDAGQPTAPRAVRVGVVGPRKSVEAFAAWVSRCRDGVAGKESPLTTLYPPFPGFGEGHPLCDFVVDDRLCDVLSRGDLKQLDGLGRRDFANGVTQRFIKGSTGLIEKNADVIVCLLWPEAVKRLDVPERADSGPRSSHRHLGSENFVWHDLFKAAALSLGKPLQVVRPATYGAGVWKYRRSGQEVKALQDEATRAWNLFCALYYKAGGVPWRLARTSGEFTACHIGVSFYREGEWVEDEDDSSLLRTSVAQVFNERGEGMVVRGGRARIDADDRTPHLTAADMKALIEHAVKAYRGEHRTLPARLAIHKSSYFDDAEVEGCEAAAEALEIDGLDLLSLRRSHTRLYRGGTYAPLRGTALVDDTGDRWFLYTQGSVNFYRCYPGLYVPRTLEVTPELVEGGEVELLTELLALTKLNWNSTALVNSDPVTLAAAKRVGGVLRHVAPGEPIRQASYAYFM
jgi:hypothetical protein